MNLGQMNTEMSQPPKAPNSVGCDGGFLDSGDDHIPEWFLSELLCRFPMRVVSQFKCVSKQFLSFISNPCFRRFYISRLPAPQRRRPPTIFYPAGRNRREVPTYEDGITEKYPELNSQNLSTFRREAGRGKFHTLAIDKGFLLVGCLERVSTGGYSDYNILYSGGEFHIYTATTQQWLTLPACPPNTCFTKENVALITQVKETGRCLTSYKVIILGFSRKNVIDLTIFSSKTRRWERFSVQFKYSLRSILWSRRPVVLNSTLYWISKGGRDKCGILAYDPYANPNHFYFVQPPDDKEDEGSDSRHFFYSNCGVCEGRLKYFTKFEDGDHNMTLKIWELQQDNKTWCLEHTSKTRVMVGDDDGRLLPRIRITLVSCHPYDPNVIYLDLWPNEMEVVSFNILTKKVVPIGPSQRDHGDVFVVEIPVWPIYIPPSLMCLRKFMNHE